MYNRNFIYFDHFFVVLKKSGIQNFVFQNFLSTWITIYKNLLWLKIKFCLRLHPDSSSFSHLRLTPSYITSSFIFTIASIRRQMLNRSVCPFASYVSRAASKTWYWRSTKYKIICSTNSFAENLVHYSHTVGVLH